VYIVKQPNYYSKKAARRENYEKDNHGIKGDIQYFSIKTEIAIFKSGR